MQFGPLHSNTTSCPSHQTRNEHTHTHTHTHTHKMVSIKNTQGESQEDSSFPADRQQAILNKADYQTIGQTMTMIIQNKSIALERSVISTWGLKPVFMHAQNALLIHEPSLNVILKQATTIFVLLILVLRLP